MATTKIAYAAAASITVTVNSLATASTRRSAAIDNSTNLYVDAEIIVSITTGSTGTSATGSISVYLYSSADDGTTFETGGSTDAAYTLRGDEHLLGVFAATANSTVYTGCYNIATKFGMPRNWGILVTNNSGGTLAASGNLTKYQGVTYTSA